MVLSGYDIEVNSQLCAYETGLLYFIVNVPFRFRSLIDSFCHTLVSLDFYNIW